MAKKIRVLHIINSLKFGGAEMNLLNLVKALDLNHLEMHVAYGGTGDLEQKFEDAGVRLFQFDSEMQKLKSFASPKIILRLARYIKKNQIDIVHTHTFNAHLWGSVAAKLTGVNIVEHVHDSRYQNPDEFEKRGETSKQYKFIKYFKNISDRVIVLTEQNAGFVVSHGINKHQNVRRIPNGIPATDVSEWSLSEKTDFRAQLSIPTNAKVVLTPTRFTPEKNTELVLKIAKQVQSEIPEVFFLIPGNGPLLKGFEERVRSLGCSEYVRTPGFYPDIPSLLSICDIFLLPSTLELQSIAIIEAMQKKCPILVSKQVGCNEEFVESWKNGVLLDPFNPPEWSDALLKILSDSDLSREIGQRGFDTYRKKFDLNNITKEFGNLYAELTRA